VTNNEQEQIKKSINWLKTMLNRLKWKSIGQLVLAISPFIFGIVLFFKLWYAADVNNIIYISYMNVFSWPLMKGVVDNIFAALFIALIAHFIIINIGTIFYGVEVLDTTQNLGKGAGSNCIWVTIVIGLVIMAVQGWMIHEVSMTVDHILRDVHSDGEVPALIHTIDAGIILIFVLFLVADSMLWLACRTRSEDHLKNKKEYLGSLIFFVDLPVIVGVSVLWFLIATLEYTEYFHPLAEYGKVKVSSVVPDTVNPSIIVDLLWQNFTMGALLGGVIFQILYSQVVFLFLNMRVIFKKNST